MDLETVNDAVSEFGFLCRGGFHPDAGDPLAVPAATVVLIGNAGSAMWHEFCRRVPPSERRRGRDPLDTWTRRTLAHAAQGLGAGVVFPFDGPPFRPFLTWAKRAEAIQSSPLGPLIHPDYGLCHAYRGAFLFDEVLTLPPPAVRPHPCATCIDKPCLTVCPVNAPRDGHFDGPACITHLRSDEGDACLTRGCRARRACPVGRDYRYDRSHARFHMRSFVTRPLGLTVGHAAERR
ncbi:MAG: ferredoxin [Rhodospirillales bacterium]